MKRLGYFYPALLALVISSEAYGAQKAMRWENGAQCEFETRFDPAKIDEEKLRNTVEVRKPTLEGKTDIRAVWRNMVEAECRENGSGRMQGRTFLWRE